MPKTLRLRGHDGQTRTVTVSDEVLAHWKRERREKIRELASAIDPDPSRDPEFDQKVRLRMKETGENYADTAMTLAEEWGERNARREVNLSAGETRPEPDADERDRMIRERMDRTQETYADAAVNLAAVGWGVAGETSADEGSYDLAGLSGMGRTNYSPKAWVRACVVHLEPTYSEPPDTTKHALPVRKPDGTLSLDAMKEAERKLLAAEDLPPEKQREAARELVGVYKLVNDNPTDSLKALAGVNYYGLSEDEDLDDEDRTIPAENGHPFSVEEAQQRAERDGISFADAAVALTIERNS